jgi:hypothetical protein
VKEKHILITLGDELKQKIEGIISAEGYHFYSAKEERESFDYVITDDVVYDKVGSEDVLVITESEPNDMKHSTIMPGVLDHEVARVAIKRFVGQDSSINIEAEYGVENYSSYKITDPFSVGHYLDVIASKAYAKELDYERIAPIYTNIANIILNRYCILPLEVDVIYGEKVQVLQMHACIKNFSLGYGVLDQTLKELDANFVDFYTLEKTKMLVVTICWIEGSKTRSYLRHHLKGFNKSSENHEIYEKINSFVNPDNAEVEYKEKHNEEELGAKIGFTKIKKIVEFLKKKKEQLGEEYNYDTCLNQYPDVETVKALTEEDHDFIKSVVGDTGTYDKFNQIVEGHKVDLFDDGNAKTKVEGGIEDVELFEISQILGEKETFEKIAGTKEDIGEDAQRVEGRIDEDDSSVRVEGTPEDIGEENALVEGEREDLTEEKTIVSGEEKTIEEMWEVKKEEILDAVDEKIWTLSEAGEENSENIERIITDVVKEILNVPQDKAEAIKEVIKDNVATLDLGDMLDTSSVDGAFSQLEVNKLKAEIQKKQEQIVRMKKIIDSMKGEFSAKMAADKELKDLYNSSGDLSEGDKLKLLQGELANKLKEIEQLQSMIEHSKKSLETSMANKDRLISFLEDKLSEYKTREFEEADKGETKAEISRLTVENNKLESQLAMTNRRLEDINAKYEAEKANTGSMQSTQMDNLQKILESEKEKARETDQKLLKVNEKLTVAKRDLKKAQEKLEVLEAGNSEASNKDLEAKVRSMEAKVKDAELDKKQAEQKLKFLSAQMKDMEKKLKFAANKAGGGGGANSGREKALERQMEKIKKNSEKVVVELAEKKKEIVKMRQESGTMSNKIKELERKLAKYEKDAA